MQRLYSSSGGKEGKRQEFDFPQVGREEILPANTRSAGPVM
jgi:hypothetical protein